MRIAIRSLWVVVLAFASTVGLAVAWTTTTAAQLLATALIMGGTGHPLSTPPDDPVAFINPYMNNAINGFINPGAAAGTGTGGAGIAGVGPADDRYAVITPEQFFPVAGLMTFDDSVAIGRANLNSCVRGAGCLYNRNSLLNPPADPPVAGDEFVIFGYSQSAVIASLVKQDLIDNPGGTPTNASFFILANAMRPNGGFLARGPKGLTIPLLGVTFYGAAPTNSCETGQCYPTIEVAGQYDGLGGDAAVSVTNVLAVLNAAAGYFLLHGDLQNRDFGDALYQGSYGDTDYYIIPARRLPILMPFEGIVPSPILTLVEAPVKAFIEGGYARNINPGVPVPVGLLPFTNPLQAILNILVAIPTGIDDALAEATNDPSFRPLGTAVVTSPFGVGGPALPDPPPPTNVSSTTMSTPSVADSATNEDAAGFAPLSAVGSASGTDPVGGDNGESELAAATGELAAATGEMGAATGDLAAATGEMGAGKQASDKKADNTLGVNTPAVTGHDSPKVRGPIQFDSQKNSEEKKEAPSAGQPGELAATTSEPESEPDDVDSQAAA